MSINITVHGNNVASVKDLNCFRDLQTLRKEAFQNKRIKRIVNVREQSKDIAKNIRRRVHNEETKLLENIRETKEKELKSWKDKHVRKCKEHYKERLKAIGEAHLNAEQEKCEDKLAQCRMVAQNVIARKRGKSAASKLKDCSNFKTIPKLSVKTPSSPWKNAATQADLSIQAEIPVHDIPAPEKDTSNGVNMSTDEDSDGESNESTLISIKPTRTYVVDEKPLTNGYDPANYAEDTTSESIAGTNVMNNRQPFTQVSDFLKKRQLQRKFEDSDPYQFERSAETSPVKITKTKSAIPTETDRSRPILKTNTGTCSIYTKATSKSSLKGKENMSQKTTKSIISSSSTSSNVPKVKYYDHHNKFAKEYEMPGNIVVRNERLAGEQNAYEEATSFKKLEREEQEELLRKRKQTPHARPELAFEKEKTRRDYESLTKELEVLTREENKIKTKAGLQQNFSEEKLRQQAELREEQLNEAVENLLRQHTTITCPKVRTEPQPTSNLSKLLSGRTKPGELNVAGAKVQFASNRSELDTDSSDIVIDTSSESCASIILGHVKKDAASALPKIQPQRETDEIDKFKELLSKVNEQKKLLDDASIVEKKQQLQERERELKEREQILEQKAKQLYEEKKQQSKKATAELTRKKAGPVDILGDKGFIKKCLQTIEDSSTTTTSTDYSSQLQSSPECPVKIIIKVNKPHKRRKSQRPEKRTKHVKLVDTLAKPGKVYPKTPRPKRLRTEMMARAEEVEEEIPVPLEKVAIPEKKVVSPVPPVIPIPEKVTISPESSLATTTGSTIYHSPPAQIGTKLTEFFKQQQQKPAEIPKPTESPVATIEKPDSRNLNPFLMHYITKLLNMSRTSIDKLGVSSSEVPTPGESLINVSENMTPNTSVQPEMDEERYKKLQKFIDDNYSFLDEIDVSLSRSLNGTYEENMNRVEDVWSQVLGHKEKQMRQQPPAKKSERTTEVRTKQSEVVKPKTVITKEKKTRAKSPAPPRRSPQMSKKVVRESFSPTKQQSIKPKIQPPRSASAPIEEKHRQVKPILKQPKPQAPEPPKNSDQEELLLDKYAELTKNCSQRITDLAEMINKVREEKQKLLQSSLSSAGTPTSGRPDSTEYLDFPPKHTSPQSADDSKATNLDKEEQPSEEIANIFKSHVHLRQMGISKDSGISMLSRPVTASESPEVWSSLQQRSKPAESQELQVIQLVPVPVKSSAYFEPLLKDIPKVMSQFKAITSLPTDDQPARKPHRPPAALARYSPQLVAEEAVPHELSTILEIETPANSRFSFTVNQSQLPQPETSKPIHISPSSGKNSFRLEITNTSDLLRVREFQNFEASTEQKVHIDVSSKSDELDFRKFEESATARKPLESSNSSCSLPDVVAELKARNMPHDFEGPPDTSNVQQIETSFDTNLSVRKFQESNISGVANLLASEGGSDTLEQDLSKMGLQWAASMMKKTKETQNLQSSSSSSANFEHSRKSVTVKSNTSAVSNTSHQGRPLNLREFLTRELMIRTHSETNSLSDDSSLSSQFLKSLLNLNTLNSTPEYTSSSTARTPIQQGTTTDKITPHRTSTPVLHTKTSGGTTVGSGTMSLNVSNDLFSGESRLSSVKLGVSSSVNSDCSISNKVKLSGMTKEDNLKIPNLKLSTDKYQSSTS